MPVRAPSTAPVGLRHKLAGHLALLRDYAGRLGEPLDLAPQLADVDEYDRLSRRYAGRPLAASRVLEIGYGARPWRQIAMQSMGVDVRGIDMEVPVLRGDPSELAAILRRNGPERFVKSAIRAALFDRRERGELARALRARGHAPRIDRSRFLVGDAAALELPPGSVDLVVSEDVFEHIPAAALPPLVDRMASWLPADGLALIRPNVFPGIMGGHVVEWNARSFAMGHEGRTTVPWAHLRGLRPPVNTFLNELTLRDYRKLFGRRFQILEETPRDPDLGREHLTPEVREQLADWPDDELFSNRVMFVLRPQQAAS